MLETGWINRKVKNMIVRHRIFVFFLFLGLAVQTALGGGQVRIVATLPDLSYIAQQIGGDKVQTFAIAKGYQDPHFVDAKPSYMIKLQKADIFVQVGLDLEIGWVPPLLEGSRNREIMWGNPGYIDASRNISLLQVPRGDPSKLRAEGDIHIFGNPHYWLDPLNGKIIAQNIFAGLVRIAPENEIYFKQNLEAFEQKIDDANQRWQALMAPYRGTEIYAYHNSWPYFEQRFGFKIAGFIEPKPGISPSPKYLAKVINDMKSKNIKIIILEPYYPAKSADLVARNTGAIVVPLAPEVDGQPGVDGYFQLFDYNVKKLIEAFKAVGIKPMHSSD